MSVRTSRHRRREGSARHSLQSSSLLRSAVLLVALVLALATPVNGATAAVTTLPEEFLGQIGGAAGAARGELDTPNGVAADRNLPGHLYVADSFNERIGEYTAWGTFVKAFGWGVANGSGELQTCTATCQAGISGSGAGQLNRPNGVAVDSLGHLYVFEQLNRRVQKFDPSGEFLLMFGGGVNKTTGEDVCTAASGDDCGIGVAGTGPAEFGIESVIGVSFDYIDIAPNGDVYVGDKDRIQVFTASGVFKSQIALPESGNPGALAIDQVSGDIYFAFAQGVLEQKKRPDVLRFDDTGVVLDELEVAAPEALATDAEGHVFIVNNLAGFGVPSLEPRVLVFDSDGDAVIGKETGFGLPEVEGTSLSGLTVNSVGDLYIANQKSPQVATVLAFGPPPVAIEDPPERAPTIIEQYAVTVDSDGAALRASINPHFWSDTRYYLEYGTKDCSANLCAQQPAPPGSLLTKKVINAPVTTPSVVLSGLEPNTEYYYRFVAESGGGGPVVGVGEGQLSGTFTTAPLPQPPKSDCPNQVFRIGYGAWLPDCRAYEMVSPVDKNNGDIAVLCNINCFPAGLNQSATGGSAITYSSYRAFGDPESAPYTSQYIAGRGMSGWSTRPLSPPRNGPSIYETSGLESQYKAFSADLTDGWILQDSALLLAPGAIEGFPNLYRQDIAVGAFEALTTVSPPKLEPNKFVPELQGVSTDGKHAVFRAKDKLTPNASTKDIQQVYEAFEGSLRLVSVRPDGSPSGAGSSVGTAGIQPNGRMSTVSNAVSDDGARIYWSESDAGTLGKLYVRVNGVQTLAVSTSAARFWTASADGAHAVFSEGGALYEYELASAPVKIADGFLGLLAASEDATEVYFLSSEALDAGATVGQPNLYRHAAGGPSEFIATLAQADVSGELSSTAPPPVYHTARATPDGDQLAFMSSASLTGYDNVDAFSGKLDAEVFLYDADGNELVCVSCNPTGARPNGRDIRKEANLVFPFWAAAHIPGGSTQLYASRVLSENGQRLFFESFDPLVSRDINGKQDVYQWEAQGEGDCADPGGCVSLVSDGQGATDTEFVDASADGNDVFLATATSLVSQDPGLIDVYDARVGGGFPRPVEEAPCEGEACQPQSLPPSDPTPASANFFGPGNLKSRSCSKGKRMVKVKRKVRCVKKGKRAKKARHGRRSR